MTDPLRILNVLVVSGGGLQGLALIKALRRSDRARVLMVDCYDDNLGRYFVDHFERVPELSRREAFLEAVLGLCAREGVRVVLPSTDHEQDVLAEERTRFLEAGVRVAVSESRLLRLVRNKHDLYATLATWGVPALPAVDPWSPDAPYPLLGKPASGWGSRDVVLLASPEERDRRWAPQMAAYVWQHYLAGAEELSVDFSVGFDGALSGFGVRRRVRTLAGFAVISDDADGSRVDDVLSRLLARMMPMGARGVFNVQLMRRGAETFVSDVNPRIGTSAVHWLGSGFDPVLHLCGLGSSPPPAPSPTRIRRTVRYLEELLVEQDAAIETRESAVRGIVFDLDDCLIAHKRWMMAKLHQVAGYGDEGLPDAQTFLAEALRLVEERPQEALFDLLAGRFGLDESLKERLIERYRAARPECPPFPDVRPTLHTLRCRGYRLGILTDNPPTSQRQKLESSSLGSLVDAVVFSREAGGEKPLRMGYDAMAERLALPQESLAMAGDNPYRDGAGALAAGYALAYVVHRPGGFWNFDPDVYGPVLRAVGAFRSVDTLRNLLRYLHGVPSSSG